MNLSNTQSPQSTFLTWLYEKLSKKRNDILTSSHKLVELSYKLENQSSRDYSSILVEIHKEMNNITSFVNDLSPHLDNSLLAGSIFQDATRIGLIMNFFSVSSSSELSVLSHEVASYLRIFCEAANATRIKITPKSIKQAFGIKLSPKEIALFFERQLENY